MRLKMVMDSEKEYLSEKDETIEEFVRSAAPKSAYDINYISLDSEETVFINGVHVSSIEISSGPQNELDEDDEIVYT